MAEVTVGRLPSSDYRYMSKKSIRALQALLALLIVVSLVRVIVVMRHRGEPTAADRNKPAAPPLAREAYVVPKRLHISSLKSAEQLTQQPVWA